VGTNDHPDAVAARKAAKLAGFEAAVKKAEEVQIEAEAARRKAESSVRID
jgi:hypothetical protein